MTNFMPGKAAARQRKRSPELVPACHDGRLAPHPFHPSDGFDFDPAPDDALRPMCGAQRWWETSGASNRSGGV